VQLCRYFVSQPSELCRHNPLCCFSTTVYCCCCCLFRYRRSPETFGYTLAHCKEILVPIEDRRKRNISLANAMCLKIKRSNENEEGRERRRKRKTYVIFNIHLLTRLITMLCVLMRCVMWNETKQEDGEWWIGRIWGGNICGLFEGTVFWNSSWQTEENDRNNRSEGPAARPLFETVTSRR
jgi:hypothetical protein